MLPTRQVLEEDDFVWTVFANRYAHGDITRGPNVYSEGMGFEGYVRAHLEWREERIAKADRPAIVHGQTNGYHGNAHTASCTAVCLDCDSATQEPDLTLLSGVRHLYQSRRVDDIVKWHLVLPLAEPIVDDYEVISSRRMTAIRYFSQLFGVKLDSSVAPAGSVFHPYTMDLEGDAVPSMSWNLGRQALDLDSLLADSNYRDPKVARRPTGSVPQKSKYAEAIAAAIEASEGWNGEPRPGKGRAILCPFVEEHSTEPFYEDSSSILLENGYIKCLHGHCMGRRQIEFVRALGIEVAPGDYPPDAQLMLALAVTDRVSVVESQIRIRRVLEEAQPYDNTASVVRVSTGAGKTHTASGFLDVYSAPVFDEETGDLLPGRSAVLALPTNALLREVEARIQSEHRVRVGVLAVLNDDGTPACQKHAVATELQRKGGDVHRLMCAKCEHRESCPARLRSRSGSGDLTITNHALLPSVVRELRDNGRVPLIVWDECPPMVESVTLKHSDLEWLLSRFEKEDRPRRIGIEDLGRAVLFDERYRRCLRPLVEVLRRVRGTTLEGAVAEYGATRVCESHLHSAESLLGLTGGGGLSTWARVCRVAGEARRLNVSEWMFDQMRTEDQEAVLRAEGLRGLLDAVMDANSVVKPGVGALEITRLTEAGAVWMRQGGVVLDATAPVTVLGALRRDVRVVDLVVADKPDALIRRVLKPVLGLSRTNIALNKAGDVLGAVIRDLTRERRLLEERLGRPAKVVVFTYRSLIPALEAGFAADYWYFGNTRGYNRWFEEGYDGFVTVGDPYSNIGVDQEVATYLKLSEEETEAFSGENARAEAAQAHGRARDPQAKRRDGERLHLHYGRLPPLGWDDLNTTLEPLNLREGVRNAAAEGF